MTISEVAPRNCPQCAGGESRVLARYSRQPWFVVQCSTCGFVYLRNPPTYEQLVSEFAWEKTRAIEKQRRKRQSPLLQALDERTRWRTGLLGGSLALLFSQIFPLGRVLDVGCGSGRRVPEPFIPFGIEISRALFEQADAHMRGRGGWAVHAPP
jgi:SAM-dependent methyltransferase